MTPGDSAQPLPPPPLSLDPLPATPIGRQGPAASPSPLSLSRFSPSRGSPDSRDRWWRKPLPLLGSILGSDGGDRRTRRKRAAVGGGVGGWQRRRTREIVMWGGLVVFFFLMNWWMFSRLQDTPIRLRRGNASDRSLPRSSILKWDINGNSRKNTGVMFSRLLGLAAHALAEADGSPEPQDLWKEPIDPSTLWKQCAYKRSWEPCDGHNGYILVSANGGINQQRVAICNAVVVARLLNATLVLPRFLYSSVWKDISQFGDIYQEEHFINYLKDDIPIVKELPVELQSLDLEAIGSIVTDAEIMKESKPSIYLKNILPILLKNSVVHFIGFGNRLAFDPIPFELQRLRCRCNFHALQFVEKIQETGALLIQRMHHGGTLPRSLERNLLGSFAERLSIEGKNNTPSKYLAMHLRFEIDMAAYSMCYFGGGKDEEDELEAYRAVHFPALMLLKNTTKVPSAAFLRAEGQCPLTPEEAVLMLAALGFKRKTFIYVAGAQIYGGKYRMATINNLYPRLATKETLLSPSEIEPFRNFSSQLAALDFIVCAAADAFAMTDSGSQLSALVSGYRMYYGDSNLPTIRPNKRRLASIFLKNSTIEWKEFEGRVRKTIKQTKQVHERPIARSVYRHPRCPECMCRVEGDLPVVLP
ncbi:O-fucosyltransferase 2-like [Zingiber officinale]|uniref:O-fucosyltransferase 2-like n=1 Tax=Zingiber officinale TaxID=94328 RepID=UPI001C4BF53E|nr:O-fucosyltransferase 2-like [Zingiber officinale]